MSARERAAWQEEIYGLLKTFGVRQVAWVPDAGHARVTARVLADPGLLGIPLTTEEEGVALACGRGSAGNAPSSWCSRAAWGTASTCSRS